MPCNTPWSGTDADKLYLTSGQFESTLKTSEYIGGIDLSPIGLSWDGTNSPWTGIVADKLYLTSGQFESTLKTSQGVGGIDNAPRGISWDGTNTPWTGSEASKLYLTSGQFESTLKTSEDVSGIDTGPRGMDWDGTNTPWSGTEADKLYLTSGQFESTLKTSEDVSGIDVSPNGISYDGLNTPWSGTDANKLYLTSGQFESTLKTSEDISGIDVSPNGISTDYVTGRLGGITFTEPFDATTSIQADIEIGIPAVEFESTSTLAADIFAGAVIDCSAGLTATGTIQTDIQLSLPVAFSTQSNLIISPAYAIPNILFTAATTLNITSLEPFSIANATRIYIFTLTGAADGVADINIPISSFQSRMQSGSSTYLSVVIPGIEYFSAINARLNGDLLLRMGYKLGSTTLITEIISRVDFENIQYNEGPTNKSIVLDGHKIETYIPKTVTLEGVSYKNINKGLLRFRCTPDLYLKPGDTAVFGSDSFIVDSITYAVSAEQEQYEVAE